MAFTPEIYPPDAPAVLEETSGECWTPLFWHQCSFPPEIFSQVMLNLIRNPNHNSSLLFRADVSLECPYTEDFHTDSEITPKIITFSGFDLKTVMIRTLIPRNILTDKPLDQTCLIYQNNKIPGEIQSLVIYLPHISSASSSPFYHPAVRGIGFLHSFVSESQTGVISIHNCFFKSEPRSVKLEKVAKHLLAVTHKHGQGTAAGYVKKAHHDILLPQATVQNTYARLKAKYSKAIINSWVECTDPTKHVFEDLNIAAFLIELWTEMYKDSEFPGFVDIGCGNGLLVHILLEEGHCGWGFDARKRKSWETYSSRTQEYLKELVLIPSIIQTNSASGKRYEHNSSSKASELNTALPYTGGPGEQPDADTNQESEPETAQNLETVNSKNLFTSLRDKNPGIHNGIFAKGTFIISNHADELTPWTPILANLSQSPFITIPCCSHSLSGARFRAPPPKGPGSSSSAYASLVVWVSLLAQACGWEVEKDMLRIPSTRNTALIGRRRVKEFEDVDIRQLIEEYGGAGGWESNAMKLVKKPARNH